MGRAHLVVCLLVASFTCWCTADVRVFDNAYAAQCTQHARCDASNYKMWIGASPSDVIPGPSDSLSIHLDDASPETDLYLIFNNTVSFMSLNLRGKMEISLSNLEIAVVTMHNGARIVVSTNTTVNIANLRSLQFSSLQLQGGSTLNFSYKAVNVSAVASPGSADSEVILANSSATQFLRETGFDFIYISEESAIYVTESNLSYVQEFTIGRVNGSGSLQLLNISATITDVISANVLVFGSSNIAVKDTVFPVNFSFFPDTMEICNIQMNNATFPLCNISAFTATGFICSNESQTKNQPHASFLGSSSMSGIVSLSSASVTVSPAAGVLHINTSKFTNNAILDVRSLNQSAAIYGDYEQTESASLLFTNAGEMRPVVFVRGKVELGGRLNLLLWEPVYAVTRFSLKPQRISHLIVLESSERISGKSTPLSDPSVAYAAEVVYDENAVEISIWLKPSPLLRSWWFWLFVFCYGAAVITLLTYIILTSFKIYRIRRRYNVDITRSEFIKLDDPMLGAVCSFIVQNPEDAQMTLPLRLVSNRFNNACKALGPKRFKVETVREYAKEKGFEALSNWPSSEEKISHEGLLAILCHLLGILTFFPHMISIVLTFHLYSTNSFRRKQNSIIGWAILEAYAWWLLFFMLPVFFSQAFINPANNTNPLPRYVVAGSIKSIGKNGAPRLQFDSSVGVDHIFYAFFAIWIIAVLLPGMIRSWYMYRFCGSAAHQQPVPLQKSRDCPTFWAMRVFFGIFSCFAGGSLAVTVIILLAYKSLRKDFKVLLGVLGMCASLGMLSLCWLIVVENGRPVYYGWIFVVLSFVFVNVFNAVAVTFWDTDADD